MEGGYNGMHDRCSIFHILTSLTPVADVRNVFVVQKRSSQSVTFPLGKRMLRTSGISM